jgi:uncharacterized protein
MTYTEVKKRNNNSYYYRVLSVRKGEKISKKRKYLGVNLSKDELKEKERLADKELNVKKKPSEISKLIPKIVLILKKNNIKKAGIFGSYARGDFKKNSDIDILIMPPKEMSLLDLSGIKIELEDNLDKKVDLVSYNYIHPLLKENILKSEVKIL